MNPTGYVQVLDEYLNGRLQNSYEYGPMRIAVRRASQVSCNFGCVFPHQYYGYDGHGSVRYLTDNNGTVKDTYDFDAYGNLIASTGTDNNPFLFAGEQYDSDLGLYYNRARYLDVRVGRFWGMDEYEGSSSDPSSLHKYVYTGANPVSSNDPSGNFGISDEAIGNIVNITISVMNVASLLGNVQQSLGSAVAAYSYFENDDPWNGTLAIGSAAAHLGMAALSAYGIKQGLSMPSPLPAFLIAGTSGAIQTLWTNPQFLRWSFGILWPAVAGLGGVYFAASHHNAEWELRDSRGRIKTRGNAESGGTHPGRSLTWPEQRATDSEAKIVEEIKESAKPGDILTIRGSKPPCPYCDRLMFDVAKRLFIRILYSDGAGYVSQYQP